MDIKIFIGFRMTGNFDEIEEKGLKRIYYEGKEFAGYFASKPTLTLKEVIEVAEKIHDNTNHITLLPVLLFG